MREPLAVPVVGLGRPTCSSTGADVASALERSVVRSPALRADWTGCRSAVIGGPRPRLRRRQATSDATASPKNRYPTQREAADAAHLRWVLDRVELDVYRCDLCDGWHMGKRFRDD